MLEVAGGIILVILVIILLPYIAIAGVYIIAIIILTILIFIIINNKTAQILALFTGGLLFFVYLFFVFKEFIDHHKKVATVQKREKSFKPSNGIENELRDSTSDVSSLKFELRKIIPAFTLSQKIQKSKHLDAIRKDLRHKKTQKENKQIEIQRARSQKLNEKAEFAKIKEQKKIIKSIRSLSRSIEKHYFCESRFFDHKSLLWIYLNNEKIHFAFYLIHAKYDDKKKGNSLKYVVEKRLVSAERHMEESVEFHSVKEMLSQMKEDVIVDMEKVSNMAND